MTGETGGVIRLLLADDEAMVRRGLRLVLETEDDLQVVGEAADGIEAIEEANRLHPDVVLMDVRMPRLDGVEACRRLVEESQTKVVVLTTFDLDEHLFAAVQIEWVKSLHRRKPRHPHQPPSPHHVSRLTFHA